MSTLTKFTAERAGPDPIHTPHPLRHHRHGLREPLPPGVLMATRPGPWGNPFVVTCDLRPHTYCVVYAAGEAERVIRDGLTYIDALDESVRQYQDWLTQAPKGIETLAAARAELRGLRLACYCPLDRPCHVDVLLRAVNWDI